MSFIVVVSYLILDSIQQVCTHLSMCTIITPVGRPTSIHPTSYQHSSTQYHGQHDTNYMLRVCRCPPTSLLHQSGAPLQYRWYVCYYAKGVVVLSWWCSSRTHLVSHTQLVIYHFGHLRLGDISGVQLYIQVVFCMMCSSVPNTLLVHSVHVVHTTVSPPPPL